MIAELGNYGTPNSTAYPFVIRQGLSLDDAIAGQFALACCDCASAFVRDNIVATLADPDFAELFSELSGSPEFNLVDVKIVSIPSNDAGRRCLWQFLGLAVGVALPQKLRAMRIKARLLKHFAEKIGGVVEFDG